ncbi:hypothetical protein [Oceanobacillus alkalisoli]|uniref:hypothetical protein n=1 Tax=Oceanobacillus alkalisoli TaxID=2925113 RepID=UPI001F11ECC7|nr:hypothetical protein [Oceanobacillus alkalisoli]MCF3943763.1 hypothetical protein [Oceanobacillus alkalisoli]
MEQETVLKEILHAFKLHAQHIDEKMDGLKTELESKMNDMKTSLESLETKMDKGFSRVDYQITELGKKSMESVLN